MRTSAKGMSLPPISSGVLQNSLLYLELKAEQEEILKHKWIESEKLGRDVGLEQAQIDWKLKHRSRWKKWRQQTRHCGAFQGQVTRQ